jgi:phage head maturation protease
VLEVEIPSKEDAKDGTALIFRKQELLEFSVCNVPANPYALAHLALSKSVSAKQDAARHDVAHNGSSVAPQFWGGFIGGGEV